MDEELSRFKDKPIEDTVEFLFPDGISHKVREIGIEKKVMLCAFAIHRKEAEKEQDKDILSFQLADTNSGSPFGRLIFWRGPSAKCGGKRGP
ncbi:MAG: hypothetical protein ACE14T_09175 [Syntrophales bacterium]